MIPKTLAIDYGTQRIGLAVSYASLAEPLRVISQTSQDVFAELQQVISQEGIEQIVIGISENDMAEQSRQFAAELKKHTTLPIHFTDETLSSKSVEDKLKQPGIKKKKRSGAIDHFAAAHFLQEWLDEQ